MSDIQILIRALVRFRDERDWAQFHDSKNLATAIGIEAAELNELFLWKKTAESEEVDRERLEEELADVLAYSLLLAHKHGIDVKTAVLGKIAKNAVKYPIESSKGNARKYDQLELVTPFTALMLKAAQEEWCTDVACSTCGYLHWRYGLIALARGEDPASPQWKVTIDEKRHAFYASTYGPPQSAFPEDLQNAIVSRLPQLDLYRLSKPDIIERYRSAINLVRFVCSSVWTNEMDRHYGLYWK